MSFEAYAKSRTTKGGLIHGVIGYTTGKTEGSMRWEGEYLDKDDDLFVSCPRFFFFFLNVDLAGRTVVVM